jgi:hypothetical protein
MTKDVGKKPIYQAPVVMPLGELATTAGECQDGSVPATDGNCTNGTGVLESCSIGYGAPGVCLAGSQAGITGGCSNGDFVATG